MTRDSTSAGTEARPTRSSGSTPAGDGRPPQGSAGDAEVRSALGVGRSKRGRWWLIALVLLLVVAIGGGVFVLRQRAARSHADPRYATAKITRGDLKVTVTATGTLRGLNTVEVGAEVSGKLSTVRADYNQLVKAGDVLAEIDPAPYQAAVAESAAQLTAARAAIRQAKATTEEARLTAARAEQQLASGLISTQQVESARATAERATAAVESAQANAAVAQASLESARTRLAKAVIVAPISGVVLSRLVEQGQTVTAGFQTPVLFKLAEDLTRMRLYVEVDEADVGRVREQAEATFTVDAYPDHTFPARVLSLHNEAKVVQNVVYYEAVLDVANADLLLKPGMTATAVITADTRQGALLVPNAALRFVPPVRQGPPIPGRAEPTVTIVEGTGPRVYVLHDTAPKALFVRTGASDGVLTELLTPGPEPGTEVIVDMEETE